MHSLSFVQPRVILVLVLMCGLILAASCGREAPYYEPGTIEVTSTPEGASIFIDGEATDEITPHTFAELVANRYEISVALEGFYPSPVNATVNLNPAGYVIQNFELDENPPALLTVESNPAGASIILDGGDTGEVTPFTFTDLVAGEVEVQLVMDGVYILPTVYTATVFSSETTLIPADTFSFRSRKTVMLEGFSNMDCGGCKPFGENVDSFMHMDGYGLDRVLYCKFSLEFPNINDPHYQHNTTENGDRMYHYSAWPIPKLKLDGAPALGTGENQTPTPAELAVLVDAALLNEPGFLVDVAADFSVPSYGSATVTLTAMQDVDLTGHSLYIALVQSFLAYDEPIGSEQISEFHWLFRDRVDTLPTLETLTEGGTSEFTATLNRHDWDLSTMYIIAFVQNDTSKEIIQAGISAPAVAPASTENKTTMRSLPGGERP